MQSSVHMREEEESEEEGNPSEAYGTAGQEMAQYQYQGKASQKGGKGWQSRTTKGSNPQVNNQMPAGGGAGAQQMGRRTQVIQTAVNWCTGQASAIEYNVYEFAQQEREEMEGYDWYGYDTEEEVNYQD